jgi:hypothetical protein
VLYGGLPSDWVLPITMISAAKAMGEPTKSNPSATPKFNTHPAYQRGSALHSWSAKTQHGVAPQLAMRIPLGTARISRQTS